MSRLALGFLVLYGLFLLVAVGSLLLTRHWALTTLGTPEELAHWEDFREEMARQAETKQGLVEHKRRKSPEPPALVLLRDYFGTCVAATLVFGSLLYAMLAFAILGSFLPSGRPVETIDETVRGKAAER